MTVTGTADVNVTNSTLPINGTVDANITNSTLNVDANVTNESLSVEVNNSAENPVMVNDVSDSNIEPFAWQGDYNNWCFNVPLGKMLIIEFVSIYLHGDEDLFCTLTINTHNGWAYVEYPIHLIHEVIDQYHHLLTGAISCKLYAVQGTQVSIRHGWWNGCNAQIYSISGYLVDVS